MDLEIDLYLLNRTTEDLFLASLDPNNAEQFEHQSVVLYEALGRLRTIIDNMRTIRRKVAA